VAEESDVAPFPLQTRVVAAVGSLGSTRFIDIGVHYHHAVEDDGYTGAVGYDLLRVPLADRSLESPPGRHDAVDRSVVLVRPEIGVPLGAFVQNLQLHSYICRITLQRRSYPESVVGARCEPELETEDEIVELLGGIQVPAASRPFRVHDYLPLFHQITGSIGLGRSIPA